MQIPLTIYTGTYGTLSNNKDEHNPMFLTTFKDRGIMPIPAYLWKVVHNEHTNEGVVFIAANGPYNNDVFSMPCGDNEFCESNGWLLTDIFCCEVNAFAENVEYAPKLSKVKIFKNPHTVNSKKRNRASDKEDGKRVKRKTCKRTDP